MGEGVGWGKIEGYTWVVIRGMCGSDGSRGTEGLIWWCWVGVVGMVVLDIKRVLRWGGRAEGELRH